MALLCAIAAAAIVLGFSVGWLLRDQQADREELERVAYVARIERYRDTIGWSSGGDKSEAV